MSSLVSIIIPSFNADLFLEQTLASVLSQSYPHWECIIVDDGSTDKTGDIAKRISATDKRIRYFYKENGGLSSARNFGMTHAVGEYIQFLDADDVLFEDKLERMILEYQRTAIQQCIIFCDYIYGMDSDPYQVNGSIHKLRLGKWNEDLNFRDIYRGWDACFTIPIHCVLFPVAALQGVRFHEKLKAKEDWQFHLEVVRKGFFYRYLDHIGCSYRVSSRGMSKNYQVMITSSFQVLSFWYNKGLLYAFRLSFFLLQAFIYRLKKQPLPLSRIISELNLTCRRRPTLLLTWLMLPASVFLKIWSSLRIRSNE